jgi:NADPH:quinone reductase-like Zn-dependent oxidoreductase
LAALTALLAFRKYKGSLEGKTVFVPAGLGGTGAYACQLAKKVFKAGKVITTLSTAKISQISLLGDCVVDQIIDYTKEDPATVIPRGSVDFLFDTMGQAMQYLSLMVPKTSAIISISTLPSGTQLQNSGLMKRPDNPQLHWLPWAVLNLLDSVKRLRARRWGVHYEYMFLHPRGIELEEIAGFVDSGSLRPVVGTRVRMDSIVELNEAAGTVYSGKGGIGKVVIEVR